MPLDAIPPELRADPKWMVGNTNKAPCNPRTGQLADVTDPSSWGSFDAARAWSSAKAHAGRYPFIGRVLTPDDPFTVLDIDVKEGESLTDQQKQILDTFRSYTERSQSGVDPVS